MSNGCCERLVPYTSTDATAASAFFAGSSGRRTSNSANYEGVVLVEFPFGEEDCEQITLPLFKHCGCPFSVSEHLSCE